jgi:hypothetical protein
MTAIKIPHAELVNYGCKNCVWRLHGQCPHNIKENEVYEFTEVIENNDTNQELKNSKCSTTSIKGYCPEFSDFLCQFAEGEDSISAVWEKFSIYMAKLQSMEDYKKFKQLEEKVRSLEEELSTLSNEDLDRLEYLQSRKDALKLWWSKLNSQVLFSLSKVVDREKKLLEKSARPINYINAKQVNFNQSKQLGHTASEGKNEKRNRKNI